MSTQNNEAEELKAQMEALRRENEQLKAATEARKDGTVSIKLSEKKAVSAYGLGRFPVTLYPEQWLKLEAAMPEIHAFIEKGEKDGLFGTPAEREAARKAAKAASAAAAAAKKAQ